MALAIAVTVRSKVSRLSALGLRAGWNADRSSVMLTEMRLVAATVVVLWGAVALAEPAVDIAVARQLLPHGEDCSDVECMIERGYVGDPEARQLALALWRDTGDVAGVGAEEWMDGGFRGRIHLVPQLPVRGHRKHLAWVAEAMRSIDALFGKLFAGQRAPARC